MLNHFDIFQKISKNIMSEPWPEPLQPLRHPQKNVLITIFCLGLYIKDFENLYQNTGDRGITSFKDSRA